ARGANQIGHRRRIFCRSTAWARCDRHGWSPAPDSHHSLEGQQGAASVRLHSRADLALLRLATIGHYKRRRSNRCACLPAAAGVVREVIHRCRRACRGSGRNSRGARPHLAASAATGGAAPGGSMIWVKLVFGGFGRRGLEAVIASGVLVLAAAIDAASLMVVEG